MSIKEPDIILNKIKEKITKEEKIAIITTLIFGLINNYNFISTKGIAPDSLAIDIFHKANKWEISLGRWGISFLDTIRGGFVDRFIIILLCMFFLALSSMFIVKTFKIKNKMSILILSAIIGVAPQFTETYMFIYCADSYCFAMLLSVLAVYFLNKSSENRIYYLFAFLCVIFSSALYQAYLGVLISLALILSIKNLFNNEDIKSEILKLIKNIVAIFIGIVSYYLITKILLKINGLELVSYKGANGVGIELIKALPKSIVQCYKDFFNFFFGNNIIYNSAWKRIYINSILFIVSFISTICIFTRNKLDKKFIRILIMTGIIALLPICMNIMDIIAPTTHINLVTGPGILTTIVLLAVIYNNLENKTLENVIKYSLILLSFILIITFILGNNITYIARQDTFNNYYTISNNIYNRVTLLEGYSKEQKWLFSDVIYYNSKYKAKANGFISNDNETWKNYGGCSELNKKFYDKYLGIDIGLCSYEKYKEITQTKEFKNMPIYPDDGSIAIIDNVVVIKISNNTF